MKILMLLQDEFEFLEVVQNVRRIAGAKNIEFLQAADKGQGLELLAADAEINTVVLFTCNRELDFPSVITEFESPRQIDRVVVVNDLETKSFRFFGATDVVNHEMLPELLVALKPHGEKTHGQTKASPAAH